MQPSPSPSLPVSRRALLLAAGLIVAATFAAYQNSFRGPFILDDEGSITDNPTIRRLGSALSPPHEGSHDGGLTVSGRPFVNLSLALNYAVGGTAVRGYHWANLAIHTAAALILFGVVRRTLRQPQLSRHEAAALPVALATAIIWAVHPLQTEAVTYVIQRAESLMGLCYLLTLYAFIRGTESGAARGWSILAVATCALGMASKEVMVSAPLIVLLYDRTFVAGSFREAWRQRRGLYAGLAGSWLLLGWLVTSTGGNRGGSIGFGIGVDWWAHALTQFQSITRYLGLCLWPRPLVFDYGMEWSGQARELAPHVLLVTGLVAATLAGLWRSTVIGFAGAWFFAILAPTSLLPARTQMAAEHRMYLPLAVVIVLGVAGIHALLGRRAWIALAGLAIGLGFLTMQRNQDYRSATTIWGDTVAKRPGNARAQLNLGASLLLEGRRAEGVTHLEQALQIKPDYSLAHNNLGVALVQLGRVPEAIAHYEEALRLNPDDGEIPHNLGDALLLLGRVPEATEQYSRALRLRPDFADAQDNNLGNVLLHEGQTARAIVLFEAALRLNPRFAEAHNNLGNALAQLGRLPEAIGHYKTALLIQPDDAEAHFNLGNAHYQSGQLKEAMSQYDAALRLKPDFAMAHSNLGSVLLRVGRREEAVKQYNEALRIDPGLEEARDNLARLQAITPAEAKGKK